MSLQSNNDLKSGKTPRTRQNEYIMLDNDSAQASFRFLA